MEMRKLKTLEDMNRKEILKYINHLLVQLDVTYKVLHKIALLNQEMDREKMIELAADSIINILNNENKFVQKF
jgi:hypothetical protein